MRILISAKDSHIFSTKNNSVFVILMFEILTKRKLTTSLVLNNWVQVNPSYVPHHEKTRIFAYAKTKVQISCAVTDLPKSEISSF